MIDPKDREEIMNIENLEKDGLDTSFYELVDDIIVEDDGEPLI